MVFTFTKPDWDWEASSEESDDWNEQRYEEKLEGMLYTVWYHRHLVRGRILQHFFLRTWRQLCLVDADVAGALYQTHLLTKAFVAWAPPFRRCAVDS